MEAHVTLSKNKVDSTALEDVQCPFHNDNGRSLILDHMRVTFLCTVCRATGPFVIERRADNVRLCLLTLKGYRDKIEVTTEPVAAGAATRERAFDKEWETRIIKNRAPLSRKALTAAAELLEPEKPTMLVCGVGEIDDGLVDWIRAHAPNVSILYLPKALLREGKAWGLFGRRKAVLASGGGR